MTIRTGIDIVSNKRIEKLLEKGRDSFYRRIFTEAEQAYLAEKNHDPATVAGLFAAKEAVSKLLGTGIGPIGWRDMEILHEDGGRPYLAPSRALYAAMEVMGISDIELSISNEEEFSVASGMGYVEGSLRIPDNMPFRLPRRPFDSHKGDFGRIGVIGGSHGMLGAVYLASYGALRTGAGIVYAILEKELARVFAAKTIEVIAKEADDPYVYRQAMDPLDVLILGPGLGTGKRQRELVEDSLLYFQKPIVVDADGLNILSDNPSLLRHRNSPAIVTPHPGEMGRLLRISTEEIQKDREAAAKKFSSAYGVITVLKGHRTIVTDGERLYLNETGNPGMATAGSGDVLSGVAGSLLAQLDDPYEAAVLAVCIHGIAGDLARKSKGEYGMIASDILENIPRAAESLVLKE